MAPIAAATFPPLHQHLQLSYCVITKCNKAADVNVRTKDKQLIPASLDALTQSTTFKQMFLDMNFELDDPELEFPVPAVNSDVF
uniref:Uncharacterized protein n=1 Tax=Ditylenchus dipsaci TaxID=166011 RepID=A0A915ESC4_9BILA